MAGPTKGKSAPRVRKSNIDRNAHAREFAPIEGDEGDRLPSDSTANSMEMLRRHGVVRTDEDTMVDPPDGEGPSLVEEAPVAVYPVGPRPHFPASSLPPEIERVLASAHRDEFLRFADWFLHATGNRGEVMWVSTPMGRVRCPILGWSEENGFMQVLVNPDSLSVEPAVEARFDVKLGNHTLDVTCVSPPLPLPGGLPMALILFLVNTPETAMEKNARIEEGITPSAVSGRPSDHVQDGEPVAGQEKAASLRRPEPSNTAENFDIPREPSAP